MSAARILHPRHPPHAGPLEGGPFSDSLSMHYNLARRLPSSHSITSWWEESMSFNEVMILTNTIPVDMVLAPSMGFWLGTIGALCAAASALVALKPQRKTQAPRLRAIRLAEVSALG